MTKPARPIPGPARTVLIAVGMVVVGLATGIGTGILSGQSGPGAIAATAGLIAAAMAAAIGGSVWWWARLDEAAREAHKWAWLWGGSAGMAVGAVPMLTFMMHGDTAEIPFWLGDTPAEAFGSGMVAILLFQTAGYGIAWAFWWLRRR